MFVTYIFKGLSDFLFSVYNSDIYLAKDLYSFSHIFSSKPQSITIRYKLYKDFNPFSFFVILKSLKWWIN